MNKISIKERRDEEFRLIFTEALKLIRKFEVREFIPVYKLKEVADKLVEAIEIDDTRIEPYIFLARIFFFVDNKELAFKYLKIAREIDPDNAEINEVKNLILRHYLGIKVS